MSIMVLNVETIEKLGNSARFLNAICSKTFYSNEIEKLFKDAYNLNIITWNKAYPDDIISDEDLEIFYKLNFNSKKRFDNIYQFLKSLQCLVYNIELKSTTCRQQVIIDQLTDLVEKTKNYIINSIDEYSEAQWG